MAKRKNERVVLENIELKPQVIGHIYKKKSNLGRVIFIFILFLIVVYYINDISVYVNNLIGKKSAETIKELTNDDIIKNKKEEETNKDEYYTFEEGLSISLENLIITHFNYENMILSFDVYNYTENDIDLSNKKYFLETYNSNKVLLNTLKVDFDKMEKKNKKSISLDLNNSFTYLKIVEKSTSDYPTVNLSYDNSGVASLICQKNNNTITYTFNKEGLSKILDIYNDSNTIDGYYIRYANNQKKVNTYNEIDGISALFNVLTSGYSVSINIDLENANMENVTDKYYFNYKEEAKIVNYEMTTYGYLCK